MMMCRLVPAPAITFFVPEIRWIRLEFPCYPWEHPENKRTAPPSPPPPITGQKFDTSFMTPIPPQVILLLMQSGWSINVIFPLTVESINGLRSRMAGGTNQREGDVDYYRIVALLRKIQQSGAAGLKIVKRENREESTVLFFYRENITPEISSAFAELRHLLRLRNYKPHHKLHQYACVNSQRDANPFFYSHHQTLSLLAFHQHSSILQVVPKSCGTMSLDH